MKVMVSLRAVAVSILAISGGLVVLAATLGVVPSQCGSPGFLMLFAGGIGWVHHRLEVLGERLAEREWAAFELGRLDGGSDDRGNVVPVVPRPRVPRRD